MPTYEIACFPCEDIFEVTCLISDRDNLHPCPNCGTTSNERLMAAPMILKQSYHDGYNRGAAWQELKQIARLKAARANLPDSKRTEVNKEIKDRQAIANKRSDKTTSKQ